MEKKRYAISRVQPVLANTTSTTPALAKGNERRNETNRQELQEYVVALKKFLKDSGEPPTTVGRFMNEKYDFPEKLKKLRLKNAMDFVKLFPEEFEFTSGGNVRLRTSRARVSIRTD